MLHVLVEVSNYQIAAFVLNMYDELIEEQPECYTDEMKDKWINTKDHEGFSALHYAVFRNNY